MEAAEYTFIVGALLPAVITMIKQESWSTLVKQVLAVAVSLVAAIVTQAIDVGFSDWEGFVANWGTIYAMAQVTYTGFWQTTKIESTLRAVGS